MKIRLFFATIAIASILTLGGAVGGAISATRYIRGSFLLTRQQQEAIWRLAITDSLPWILLCQGGLGAIAYLWAKDDMEKAIARHYLMQPKVQRELTGSTLTEIQGYFLSQAQGQEER